MQKEHSDDTEIDYNAEQKYIHFLWRESTQKKHWIQFHNILIFFDDQCEKSTTDKKKVDAVTERQNSSGQKNPPFNWIAQRLFVLSQSSFH